MPEPRSMDPGPDAAAEPTAQQAIERVLEAEREARAAVEACEAQGTRIVAEARQSARRIAERADARIDAMRSAARAGLAAQLARLNAEAQVVAVIAPETQARMAAAVEAMAARLSGGTP